MSIPRILPALVLIFFLLAIVGCGDSPKTSPAPSPGPQQPTTTPPGGDKQTGGKNKRQGPPPPPPIEPVQ